jgi:hypothetical protein
MSTLPLVENDIKQNAETALESPETILTERDFATGVDVRSDLDAQSGALDYR